MGHDEAIVTQMLGKPPSPPKDQPALYPCIDWSAMQAYYAPGFLPSTYFAPGIAPGHAPPPYMWGPQPLLPSPSGKPYAAIYPHGGGFSHPFVPLMVNPLSAEPAISVNSKENGLNRKLKEIDETAASTCSCSDKTSGAYSVGGSSDGNNQKASRTPKKRRFYDGPMSDDKKAFDYPLGAETSGISSANGIPQEQGRLAILPNLGITASKLDSSTASDFSIIDTPVSAEFPDKDDRESKRERRKQSNRESARRSRLRKQAETDDLARKVELLTANNTSLRRDISRLTASSKKLGLENSALMEKLRDSAPDEAQEVSADRTTEHSAGAVKNVMSMIDSASGSRTSSGHLEHGAPKLRQLLGSGLAADAVANSTHTCMWPGDFYKRMQAGRRINTSN